MPLDVTTHIQTQERHKTSKVKLYCAACGHLITYGDYRIRRKEAHEHTVFNPAGIVFNIGCFKDAPGCFTSGNPSPDFSWFATYQWQLAFCQGCSRHLGWRFTSDKRLDSFYGLILNHLSDKPLD